MEAVFDRKEVYDYLKRIDSSVLKAYIRKNGDKDISKSVREDNLCKSINTLSVTLFNTFKNAITFDSIKKKNNNVVMTFDLNVMFNVDFTYNHSGHDGVHEIFLIEKSGSVRTTHQAFNNNSEFDRVFINYENAIHKYHTRPNEESKRGLRLTYEHIMYFLKYLCDYSGKKYKVVISGNIEPKSGYVEWKCYIKENNFLHKLGLGKKYRVFYIQEENVIHKSTLLQHVFNYAPFILRGRDCYLIPSEESIEHVYVVLKEFDSDKEYKCLMLKTKSILSPTNVDYKLLVFNGVI